MKNYKQIAVPVALFRALRNDTESSVEGCSRLDAFINLVEAAESSKENSTAVFNGETIYLAPGQVAVSVQALEKKVELGQRVCQIFSPDTFCSRCDLLRDPWPGYNFFFPFP